MSDRPWWSHLLQWGLFFIVMTLITRWLNSTRRSADVSGQARILQHPGSTTAIGVGCTVLGVAITILSCLFAKPHERWVPYVFLAFTVLGASLIVEGVRVRHELTEMGISYRGMLRSYSIVNWREIVSARWAPTLKWLVLTTRDGRNLRFSAMLNGLPELAVNLQRNAPHVTADTVTDSMLYEARNGNLPSVWQ
jgi:Bacterial PH domain